MATEIDNFLAKTESEVPKVETPDSSVSRWYSGQDKLSKADLSFKASQEIAPDFASRVIKIQSKTGLPEDLIHKNLDVVEKESNASDFDPKTFLKESPITASWMSESPNNAAIIKDNIKSFQDIENSMQDYSMLSMMYKSLNYGLANAYSNAAKIPALIYDVGAIPQNLAAKATGIKSLQAEAPSWLLNNPISKYYDEQADAFKPPEIDQSITKEIKAGNFSRAGRILAAQVVANAPQQAAILVGGLSGYGGRTLIGMGAMAGAGVVAENQDKPHDPLALTADALMQGTFEAAFESLGTGGILKHWENAIAKEYGKDISRRVFADFGKTLFYSFAGEGNEEFVTQLSQDYADYITGINPDALHGTLTRAIDAGIIGGASGATMTAPTAIVAGSARGARIRQSTLAKDFYLQLGSKVQESKILEKSPESASILVDRMTKDSPVENVYLSPQALEEKITSLGQDPLKVIQEMGLLPTYNEAKRTGTDMQIPMNHWVVKGNALYQSMADDIKFTPDASSVNQTKQVKEQVKQEAIKADETIVEPTKEQASAAKVGEEIVQQLKQAGFEEGVAKQYAKLHEEAFGTIASKAGVDPLELFSNYGLQIRRPDVQETVPQGTTQMEQGTIVPAEGSVVGQQALPSPTEQSLQGQQGTTSEIKAMRDKVFPGPVSSHESIALEPDYYKLKADAADVVDRHAKQRGIEANNQFAVSLWQELHDALGSIRTAKEADRLAIATQVMAKYPTIEQDFMTLKEQIWSDATEGYFDKFIKGQYQPKNDEAFYQSAFHGTPHKFDKFSLHHIGTGEGAQSYGWGLYFASKKEVAEGYREQLAGELITTNLKVGDFQVIRNEKQLDYSPKGDSVYENVRSSIIEDILLDQAAVDASFSIGGEKAVKEHVLKMVDEKIDSYKTEWPEAVEPLKKFREKINKPGGIKIQAEKQGHVYEVDIPDDKEFLSWDNTLINQSEKIKSVLPIIEKDLGNFAESMAEKINAPVAEWSGQELYHVLTSYAAEKPLPGDDKTIVNASEAASRYLSRIGIAGIKYADQFSRKTLRILSPQDSVSGKWVVGEAPNGPNEFFSTEEKARAYMASEESKKTHNYVVFDDKLVSILNRYQQGERGVIRFGKNRQFNIDLFKAADLSTFLHESGHFFLEVMADVAALPTANQEIKDDLAAIYKYLGVENRDEIKRSHHETFARTFEAYLMTSKAPSTALREAFSRFKSWLLSIYRNIRNLNVPITPEIKSVFDRMLASEEAIREAQNNSEAVPLFSDPKSVGMSDAEADRYTRSVLEAKTDAEDELTTKLMKEAQREQEAWWKSEREKIEKEVSAKIDQSPGLIALYALQYGTLPNGEPLPEGLQAIKLSKSAIENNFPEYPIKDLPKPHVYAVEGGIHPDEAAAIFGFKSGAELLFNIQTEPSRNEAIKRETDEIMQGQFGDLMKHPIAMANEAKNAIHNDKRAELLRAELQHLASNNLATLKGLVRRIAKPIPSMADVRFQAEAIIGEKKVRNIQPSLYETAEKTASKEAVDFLLKGDIDSAFEAKKRELLNHELFRAATNAVDSINQTVAYMSKFGRTSIREKLGKAGEEYLDQIDSILDRFDFRKNVSLKSIDRRKALVSWIEEQRAEGNEPDISDEVINESYRQHYKDVSYDILSGIRDSVKTIDHLASVKTKLMASERMRALDTARDEIVASIQAHHKIQAEPLDFAPSISKTMIKGASRFAAYHTRMEFLFQFLDGNKANGSTWDILFKPMADAENHEHRMMKDVSENLHRIFNAYTREERASWFLNRTFYPEIGSHMTKGNLLVLALNWGNEYNREAILEGYGWSAQQALSLLDKLDERDWKTVQALWDYIDTFWPQARELERDINGIAPEKVSSSEVRTRFGTLKGGYYPIVFDKSLSFRQTQFAERASVKEMFGGNSFAAMTKHGHLKARKGTGGAKLLLEFSGLTNHLSDVVHDLAYRRAVIDAHKIINHPDVRFNIEASAGREMYKQLGPWLHAIAGDRRGEPANPIEGIFASARAGATVVNLGLKVTSGLVQTLGYLNTVKEIGRPYALQGLKETYLKPFEISKQWSFITERSEMMRVRIENWDRDIRDSMKRLSVAQQPGIASKALVKFGADRFAVKLAELQSYSPEMQQSFFSFVGYMDLAMSVPTWLGAYRKAMDGKVENINAGDEKAASEYSDSVVRMTQSSGSAKDNAAIQRGQEAFKIFTMFYSQLSLQFNLFQKSFNQFRIDGNKAQLIGALSLLWFIPAVMEDLVRGRPPEGDDEDKYLKWLLRKEMLYPFNTIVLGRDLANAADRYLQTGTKDFQGSPVFDAGSAAIGAFLSLPVKIATGEEITRGDVRDVTNMAGYIFKLPSRQIWMTADYLYAWMTGDQSPSNPLEGAFRALVSGREK